jgi:hypothetical protein
MSDDPNWWRRYEHRRQFRVDQLNPIVVMERGYPCDRAMLKSRTLAGVWDDSQEFVAEYLRALGLSRRPDWVYGVGPRGVWVDDPGRWFIAHAATADMVTAARAHVPGTGPPPSSSAAIAFVSIGKYPVALVARDKGEPAPSIADALMAVVLYGGLDPADCFGACPLAYPQFVHEENWYQGMTVASDGIMVTAAYDRIAPWQQAFRRDAPHRVPFDGVVAGRAGPVAVVRLAHGDVFARRVEQRDVTVPASPIELAVAFVETVGIKPADCWGICEVQLGSDARDTYTQVIYRPGPDDAAGRDRFTRYVAALGANPAALDYGRREGRMVASGKRFKIVRGSGV